MFKGLTRLTGPSIIDRGLARCLDCQMCAHVKVKANFKERKKHFSFVAIPDNANKSLMTF